MCFISSVSEPWRLQGQQHQLHWNQRSLFWSGGCNSTSATTSGPWAKGEDFHLILYSSEAYEPTWASRKACDTEGTAWAGRLLCPLPRGRWRIRHDFPFCLSYKTKRLVWTRFTRNVEGWGIPVRFHLTHFQLPGSWGWALSSRMLRVSSSTELFWGFFRAQKEAFSQFSQNTILIKWLLA